MQKTISIESVVLGEKSDGTQMKFYEETKVLGAEVEHEIQQQKKLNLLKVFLECLEEFNRFVLSLWEKVFDLFR